VLEDEGRLRVTVGGWQWPRFSRGFRLPLFQDRLLRTAWPLVVNTASNGVLGVAFWVVAARAYEPSTVATNLAMISAMMTVSGICQLNLGPGLAVLVPRARERARRVILQAYGAATAFSVPALLVFFFLILPHLDKLSATVDTPYSMLLFAAAVVAFSLFALQDAALVSLRRGRWIPVENAVFGVLKLGLLLALASAIPSSGIFLSWLLPMVLIIPVVSGFVLTRRPPPTSAERRPTGRPESFRGLALDYVGYLFNLASTVFLPVVALELLNSEQASVFAVAWLTSSTLDLLSTNIGTALTVETTYGEDPGALRRTVLRRALPLVACASALGALAAPLILGLYGHRYSESGTLVLQLLLLASVPRALINFCVAEARAHRDIGFIVWLRGQNTTVTLVSASVLAPLWGARGMAIAWLLAQTLGAANAVRHAIKVRPLAHR
jgi:hypothetical protein